MEWGFVCHGALMVLGFVGFTTFSVFVALNRKRAEKVLPAWIAKYGWLDVHLKLQLVGFLCSIVAFIIVFNTVDVHMKTPHSVIGMICIVVTALILPHLGLPDDTDDNKAEALRAHSQLGKGILPLCYLNILIGLWMVGVSVGILIAFVVLIGLLCALLYRRQVRLLLGIKKQKNKQRK